MSSIEPRTPTAISFLPGLAIMLAGGVLLAAGPAVRAQTSVHHHHHRSSAIATQLQHETVEQRIVTLHKDLAITPDEEASWSRVAAVMRRNETTMRDMVAARHQSGAQPVNAVEDLVIYQRFNQAHADGLNDLIVSFKALYQTMPASQQTVADQVFRGFGHNRPLHS